MAENRPTPPPPPINPPDETWGGASVRTPPPPPPVPVKRARVEAPRPVALSDKGSECAYLLVDGENIHAVLTQLLGNRDATPDERPLWANLMEFARSHYKCEVKGLFFMNTSSGTLPMPFIQAIQSAGYKAVPVRGRTDQQVIDLAIQKTLDAIREKGDHVMLASHDPYLAPAVRALMTPGRRVTIIGFEEYVSTPYQELRPAGLEVHDLENETTCFPTRLPRTRIMDVDAFDPTDIL